MRFKGTKITLKRDRKVAVKIGYFQAGLDRGLRFAWKSPGRVTGGSTLGKNAVETYLPAGADWYDFWTNERFTGGQQGMPDRHPASVCPRRFHRTDESGHAVSRRKAYAGGQIIDYADKTAAVKF